MLDFRATQEAAIDRLVLMAKFAANCPRQDEDLARRRLRAAIETFEYHRDRAKEQEAKWEEKEQTRDLAELKERGIMP